MFVWKYLTRKRTDKKAVRAAQSAPMMVALRKEAAEAVNNSGSLAMAAAPMMGVASKKLKRAASSLFKPNNKPPAMEEPEREIPGNSAVAWTEPI